MTNRLNYFQASPEAMKTLMDAEKHITNCYKSKMSLDHKLVELIKIRVSQINGCAYCVDMHTKDARAISEEEQRIFCLSVWRKSPFYSEQERAALEWAELNTLVASNGISHSDFIKVKEFFNDEQLVDLTIAITTINSWNRIAISFAPEVGVYKSGDFDE